MCIKYYNAPTLFIFGDIGKSGKKYVFGAFVKEMWENKLEWQGDGGTYLFTLHPEFRLLVPYRGKGSWNYAYLNDDFRGDLSNYKQGLGFGGNDKFTKWRIWIDKKEKNSYATAMDNTFEHGFLTEKSEGMKMLNLFNIEIWGFGDEKTLEE